jgi:lipoyl(octanoyl) transferase
MHSVSVFMCRRESRRRKMTAINEQLRALDIIDCGLSDFSEILNKQHELCIKRQLGQIPDTVLITEHKQVITLGARQTANKLLLDKKKLSDKGIEVIEVRRGGGTTAHNPGQLVFYPIVNLKELHQGISEYVRTLEQIGIELLAGLDVIASRKSGYPGLWTKRKKIASVGIRVSRSITHHGMAININNDLSIFDYIIACGLDDVEMTSVLAEKGIQVPMKQVKKILITALQRFLVKPGC